MFFNYKKKMFFKELLTEWFFREPIMFCFLLWHHLETPFIFFRMLKVAHKC